MQQLGPRCDVVLEREELGGRFWKAHPWSVSAALTGAGEIASAPGDSPQLRVPHICACNSQFCPG